MKQTADVLQWRKALSCLELRGQYFLTHQQQQFQQNVAFATAMEKNLYFSIQLFYKLKCFDLAINNSRLGRLEKLHLSWKKPDTLF